MKNRSVLCALVVLLLACDPPGDNRFWITNPTNDSLYYYQVYERYPLPDRNPFSQYEANQLYPHERRNLRLGTGSWDGKILSNSPQDSSLLLYVFPKKTIREKAWSTIREQRLYQVYRLHIHELRRQNWQIVLKDKYRIH